MKYSNENIFSCSFSFLQVRPVIAPNMSTVFGVELTPVELEILLLNPGVPAVFPTDITWSRQGKVVNQSDNVNISSDGLKLHINKVTEADEGVYTVTVRNAAGSVSTNISLDHRGEWVNVELPGTVFIKITACTTYNYSLIKKTENNRKMSRRQKHLARGLHHLKVALFLSINPLNTQSGQRFRLV